MATEDEMVGWGHRLNGHKFEQTPGDSERQGSLMCCSPWSLKESDTTERLNSNKAGSYLIQGLAKTIGRRGKTGLRQISNFFL